MFSFLLCAIFIFIYKIYSDFNPSTAISHASKIIQINLVVKVKKSKAISSKYFVVQSGSFSFNVKIIDL